MHADLASCKKWPNELGEVFGAGDFSTGLVQNAIVPPQAMRTATQVSVWVSPSPNDVRWETFRTGEKVSPDR